MFLLSLLNLFFLCHARFGLILTQDMVGLARSVWQSSHPHKTGQVKDSSWEDKEPPDSRVWGTLSISTQLEPLCRLCS